MRKSLLFVTVIGLNGACGTEQIAAQHGAGAGNASQAHSTTSPRPAGHHPGNQDCAVIPVEIVDQRIVVPFALGDGDPRRALFDTGAMRTVINLSLATELRLPNDGPLAAPFNRPGHEGHQTSLQGARLGTFAIPTGSVPAMPLPLPGFDAVISANSFPGTLVSVDLGASQIRICRRTQASMPSGPAHPYSAGPFVLPTVAVTIGAENIDAHIDTGSPLGLLLPLSLAEQLPLSQPPRQIGEMGTHGGPRRPLYQARIRGQVRIGQFTLTDPEVHFAELSSGPNIGMRVLREMVLTLDPDGQRAWVTARGN
jgi:hypothetical protein